MATNVVKQEAAGWVHSVAVLLIFLVICFGAAAIGGYATAGSVNSDWFENLRKPSWNPPNWVFGPVWTFLYATMAIAGWLVWKASGVRESRFALSLFSFQLGLNVLWSCLFFGMQRIGLAVLDIGCLWLAILGCIAAFHRQSRTAAYLLLPYLAWVTFAAVLNAAIWRLN